MKNLIPVLILMAAGGVFTACSDSDDDDDDTPAVQNPSNPGISDNEGQNPDITTPEEKSLTVEFTQESGTDEFKGGVYTETLKDKNITVKSISCEFKADREGTDLNFFFKVGSGWAYLKQSMPTTRIQKLQQNGKL